MITVRRATLADRSAIFEFVRQIYPSRWQYKIPERWEWEYCRNPFAEGERLPIWIAIDEHGKVIGQTGAMIEPLKLGGQRARVGWSVDTYVLPEYRGQGLGYRLQQANDQAQKVFMSLSMSEANQRIKAALGSVPLEGVSEYVKTMRHGPERALTTILDRAFGAERQLPSAFLAPCRLLSLDRAAAAALTWRSRRRDARLIRSIDREVAISPVDRFGDEADRLWMDVAPHYHSLVIRDHRYLNWKFVDQPHMHHVRLIARRGQNVCGYLILRTGKPPEPNIGLIVDLFSSPQDQSTLEALLAYAVRHFTEEAVDVIKSATTIDSYRRSLVRFGFRKIREIIPMIHCKLEGSECEHSQKPGSWFLTIGDHDWNQYPNA